MCISSACNRVHMSYFTSAPENVPEKCVTPHSGSVADRTDFSRPQQEVNWQERLKAEGGSSPIRLGPHRVQRTDLSYFCGEVRNTSVKSRPRSRKLPSSIPIPLKIRRVLGLLPVNSYVEG
ncbi:hypothetical protein AVEN_81713-1 [Araneus ventricosus]|uniref:Uncharacterized protein n=1 Tax=Araneus ventricosus TaxID=182803 RepID=A0A4Y2IAV4_ARAVE|nr:hypothetical protein AVEN_81713-1 [Araneus ventricosus]